MTGRLVIVNQFFWDNGLSGSAAFPAVYSTAWTACPSLVRLMMAGLRITSGQEVLNPSKDIAR
jgi:hypothetical protein